MAGRRIAQSEDDIVRDEAAAVFELDTKRPLGANALDGANITADLDELYVGWRCELRFAKRRLEVFAVDLPR